MRDLTIRPALNGYVVQAGCQQVVFTSRGSLLEALEAYLRDPKGTEALFLNAAVNPMDPAVQIPLDCCNTSRNTDVRGNSVR
jgi:hypothetical protein